MRDLNDDSLTEAQLRWVDKWSAISLASAGVLAIALLAAVLLVIAPARSEPLGKLDTAFEGHYALHSDTDGSLQRQRHEASFARGIGNGQER